MYVTTKGILRSV